jgi:hypothetical protein
LSEHAQHGKTACSKKLSFKFMSTAEIWAFKQSSSGAAELQLQLEACQSSALSRKFSQSKFEPSLCLISSNATYREADLTKLHEARRVGGAKDAWAVMLGFSFVPAEVLASASSRCQPDLGCCLAHKHL